MNGLCLGDDESIPLTSISSVPLSRTSLEVYIDLEATAGIAVIVRPLGTTVKLHEYDNNVVVMFVD